MSDKPPLLLPKRPLVTFRGIVAQFVLVWIIYTLSIGPMYWTWFAARYIDGSYWIIAFYAPLQAACEYVPYYGDWVEGFIWWWNFPSPGSVAEPAHQLVAG
jgi:hypothetical protein